MLLATPGTGPDPGPEQATEVEQAAEVPTDPTPGTGPDPQPEQATEVEQAAEVPTDPTPGTGPDPQPEQATDVATDDSVGSAATDEDNTNKRSIAYVASQILGRSPRKRKKARTKSISSDSTSSSKDKESDGVKSSASSESEDQKENDKEMEDADIIKQYETCCAKNDCEKRQNQVYGLKGKIVPQDKTLKPRTCSRCKGNAHFDCTRVKFNKYFCLPCFRMVKEQQEQEQAQSKKLKRPPIQHVVCLPSDLAASVPTNEDEHGDCPRITRDSFDKIAYDTMDVMGYDSCDVMTRKERAHNRWVNEMKPRLHEMTVKERKTYTDKLKRWEQYRKEWFRGLRVARKEALTAVEAAVTGLRYDKKRKKWFVQVQWTNESGDVAEQDFNSETIEVERSWVMEVFKPDVYKFVEDFESLTEYGFHPVPKNNTVNFGVNNRMVSKVKYCPATEKRPAKYFVKFTDNLSKDTEEEMSEETLLTLFDPNFLRLVRSRGYNRRQFVHIPPGDVRSGGWEELCPISKKPAIPLPPVKFRQYDRKTCVCSSFASALWAVGFQELALEINTLGIETEQDPNVLVKVATWVSQNRNRSHCLQPRKIKQSSSPAFSLMDADLTNSLALVVLSASDGSRSHAITVHDGYIFDGNEATALPLSIEALNYVCSTRERKASFTGVVAGYLFVQQGKKNRLAALKRNRDGDPWRKSADVVP